MLKGEGAERTDSAGSSEAEGTLVVDGLVVELEEWFVEAEAEAETKVEAVLVADDIMVGRPAIEAYIDDPWR